MIVHKDNCVSRKSIIVFVRIKVFLAISIVAICNNHNEGSSQVFQGQVFQFKLFISLARNVMIIPNLRPNCPLHKSERNNMYCGYLFKDLYLKGTFNFIATVVYQTVGFLQCLLSSFTIYSSNSKYCCCRLSSRLQYIWPSNLPNWTFH